MILPPCHLTDNLVLIIYLLPHQTAGAYWLLFTVTKLCRLRKGEPEMPYCIPNLPDPSQ